MHVFLAEEARRDAVDDGIVDFAQANFLGRAPRDLTIGSYEVDPRVLDALRRYPQQFRAGVLGPDAYPDIATGNL